MWQYKCYSKVLVKAAKQGKALFIREIRSNRDHDD